MKILLLTDVPPCKEFSGSLLTEQLCRFLPKGSLACFAVMDPTLQDVKKSTELDWLPIEYAKKPSEQAWRILPGALGGVSAFVREQYAARVEIQTLTKRIVQFAKRVKADRIWSILQGQTIIRLSLPVSQQLGLPLLTQVWDSPEWWLWHRNTDFLSRQIILRRFDRTIRESAYVGVASFVMAEQYRKEYRAKAVPLVASLDAHVARAPALGLNNSSCLRIGIAGQLYAQQEWNVLLSALDAVNWEILGRRVIIRFLGYRFAMGGHRAVHVEFLGYRGQIETLDLLSECDLLYCPYPFDEDFKMTTRTSFPSKLTTYLACGRPVLFHGPDYASPAFFLRENQAGVLCCSLEKEDLARTLTGMVTDQDAYSTYSENGVKAFGKYLTLTNLRKCLATFLRVEENALLPLT